MHSQCQTETETETEMEMEMAEPGGAWSHIVPCASVPVVARKFIHAPQVVGRGQMNDMAPPPVRQLFRQLN